MYLNLPFLTDRTKSYFSSNLSAYPKVIFCFSRFCFFKPFPKNGFPSTDFGISTPAIESTVGTKSTNSTNVDVRDPFLNGDSFLNFSGTRTTKGTFKPLSYM